MPKALHTLLLLALIATNAHAISGERIHRSRAEVLGFRSANACPSTGAFGQRCTGYEVDHSIALCMGGLDLRANMAWLSVQDHRFKTFVDVRECRKLARMAATPVVLRSNKNTDRH